MNTTLLLPLTASPKSGPTSPVPLSDVPDVRLELRLIGRSARKRQTRHQPLARALQQVVEKHRTDWSTPAATPVVAVPTPTPSRPFHLVVPALDVAPASNDTRRAAHPILRAGSKHRETN
jgi:hypothetical protein